MERLGFAAPKATKHSVSPTLLTGLRDIEI